VSQHVETVINALSHRHVEFLPRGELFIGSDFLDHHFPDDKGHYERQLRKAAQSLGLSLIGVDFNTEESPFLLSGETRRQLEEYFLVGWINGPISHLIDEQGFRGAMLSMRNNPSLFSGVAAKLLREMEGKIISARSNGLQAIAITDDIAGNNGLLFSLQYFTDTIQPVYRELAGAIKAGGLYPFIHSDGDTRKVIGALIEAGFVCIHPVDTQAGLDLYTLQKEFGKQLSFMGNADVFAWDKERISNDMGRAEKEFQEGGLILGSTGGISMKVADDKLGTLHPRWEQRGLSV
jgi:uroporphyrinogen decarboxylase